MPKSKKIFLSVIVLPFGWITGFIAGATYGGNVTCPDAAECTFHIFSAYGYEATALIGGVIGFIITGLILCYLLFIKQRAK